MPAYKWRNLLENPCAKVLIYGASVVAPMIAGYEASIHLDNSKLFAGGMAISTVISAAPNVRNILQNYFGEKEQIL